MIPPFYQHPPPPPIDPPLLLLRHHVKKKDNQKKAFSLAMSAVNRTLRTATKQLRFQSPRGLRVAAPLVARSALGAARSSLPVSHGAFSTSAARRSGAPDMSSTQREYDPEIKDIADYVANKTIDSELAVSISNSSCDQVLPRPRFCTPQYTPPPSFTHLNTRGTITRNSIGVQLQ